MIFMTKTNKNRKLLTGNEAVAYAMMQVNPDVCCVYHITPQTQIIDTFSKYVSDGKVTTENILVESEHSAMSACIGASASGARAFTASASQGLAYMAEVVYVAAGLRLPIVMAVANRGLSAPITLGCDHSDTFMLRDSGWIQIYCEDVQEVYDYMVMSFRIAESINFPVMIMMDGFFTSHGEQVLNILDDKLVKKFVGKKPKTDNLLDSKVTIGGVGLTDIYLESKAQQYLAMEDARKKIEEVHKSFAKLSKRNYVFYDAYKVKDADLVFVVLGSAAQTLKIVCEQFREKGVKVGVLRPKVYRPFPHASLKKELENKKIVVLDRAISFGSEYGPLGLEFQAMGKEFYNVMFGLSGRNFGVEDAKKLVQKFLKAKQPKFQFYGLREDVKL